MWCDSAPLNMRTIPLFNVNCQLEGGVKISCLLSADGPRKQGAHSLKISSRIWTLLLSGRLKR